MKHSVRMVLVLCLLAASSHAQAPPELLKETPSAPAQSRVASGDIVFAVDFCAFRGLEGKTREEMYFQLQSA